MDHSKQKPEKANRDKCEKGVLLILLFIIFLLLFFVGGVETYSDTDSYLKMSPVREPGYALLLNLFVTIFGTKGFWVLGFVQNALAAISIYLVVCYISSKFKSKLVMPGVVLCMLLPHLITPFFASSGIILTNAMLTEGVTLSLYNLFVLYLLKAVWEKEQQKKFYLVSFVLAFLLSFIRNQMLVCLCAWIVVVLLLLLKQKKVGKILTVLGCFVLVLLLRGLGVCSYNLAVNGEFTGNTYGSVTVLSNVIYVSDRDDGEDLAPGLQPLFYDIYDIAQTGHMLRRDAPDDFIQEAAFYTRMHDLIKDEAIYPYLQNYSSSIQPGISYTQQMMMMDEICKQLTKELLPQCFGDWLSNYLQNMLVGFIRTVAFVHPLFNMAALVGYLILLVMGWYCYHLNHESKAVKLLLLTALLTLGNVAAVALTIMCLSRYMIYNMAWIYITSMLMLIEIMTGKEEKNEL